MIETTLTNQGATSISEKDLDEMLMLVAKMKPTIVPQHKIIMGCRKHIKQLQERFKTTNAADPRISMLSGIPVHLYIKPYLKKLYVIDMPKQVL